MSSPFTLAITSLKPHGGRTTTALALAWALGRAGRRVLLVDANLYPELLPKRSQTGSHELWEGVFLGSRKAGEAREVGAEVVVVDAPPLTGKKPERILAASDAVLLTVFPIVQNARFLPRAQERLREIEPHRLLGWMAANVGDGNRHHADLLADLERELGDLPLLGCVPALRDVSGWQPMTGADLPEGRLRDAYLAIVRQVETRLPHPAGPPRAAAPAAGRSEASEARPAHAGSVPAAGEAGQALARNLLPKAPPPQTARFVAPAPAPPTRPSAPAPAGAAASLPPTAHGTEGPRTEAPRAAASAEPQPRPARTPAPPLETTPTSASLERLLDDVERAGAAETAPSSEAVEPPPAIPAATVTGGPAESDDGAPRWRFLPERNPRISIGLISVESHLERGEHVDLLPESVPSGALRALLRFGLVHSVRRGSEDPGTAGTEPGPRLRALQETRLPVPPRRGMREDTLLSACRSLAEGDGASALRKLEGSRKVDARFLAAFLRLGGGEPEAARKHLLAALRAGSRLGVDLAQHGLALVVKVELDHGVAMHFGANTRGVHVGRILAARQRGDARETLAELRELATLEPGDVLVRALLVERLLDADGGFEFDALHRSSTSHAFQTRVHTALAYYRALALHGMGLPEAAYLSLTEAIEAEGHRTDSLRHALLFERVRVAETLGRIQHVRRDLEVLFAEDPDYADVGRRLGLAA